jgi:uncharacterized membrane protein YjgN (DUF898 family)
MDIESTSSQPANSGGTREPAVDSVAQLEIAQSSPTTTSMQMHFTGDGAEYFRIWSVNLLLTICSLGIYSAWAKVRKTRYFYQNTRLDGHAFDYHGTPKAILRGRIVAVVLLTAYTWAFDISTTAGFLTIAFLCVAGPWLFLRSQQFKFRNTSWRGLRFGFSARTSDAYRSLLPLLIIWFSSTVVGFISGATSVLIAVMGAVTAITLPWMHHTLKRFQHRHIRYGQLSSEFDSSIKRFYGIYVKCMLLIVGIGFLTAATFGFFTAGLEESGVFGERRGVGALLVGVVTAALVYLLMASYAAARVQRVVWTNTRLGPVKFDTHLSAGSLAWLVSKNVALTLITAGLFWPYASISIARYRIECMRVSAPENFAAAISKGDRSSSDAMGEGALDMFGVDIGL